MPDTLAPLAPIPPHPMRLRAADFFAAIHDALQAGATTDQAIAAAREAVRD